MDVKPRDYVVGRPTMPGWQQNDWDIPITLLMNRLYILYMWRDLL